MVVIEDQMVRMAKFCNFYVRFVISSPKNIENDTKLYQKFFYLLYVIKIIFFLPNSPTLTPPYKKSCEYFLKAL